MIKTQIQLEPWQHEKLKELSRRQSRSIADLIRESVTHLLRARELDALPPLREVAGKYRPIPVDDLKEHDRAWSEAIR
jgi:hypothetical protein